MILPRLIQFFILTLLMMFFSPPTFTQEWPSEMSISQKTIIFTLSTVCPCSQSHLPHLFKMAKEFPQMSFIGLHTDLYASEKEYNDFLQTNKNLGIKFINDKGLIMARKLKAITTPHVFVFDENKKLLYHGGISDSHTFEDGKTSYLEEVLKKITSSEALSFQHQPPLGCSISY